MSALDFIFCCFSRSGKLTSDSIFGRCGSINAWAHFNWMLLVDSLLALSIFRPFNRLLNQIQPNYEVLSSNHDTQKKNMKTRKYIFFDGVSHHSSEIQLKNIKNMLNKSIEVHYFFNHLTFPWEKFPPKFLYGSILSSGNPPRNKAKACRRFTSFRSHGETSGFPAKSLEP